MCQPVMWGAAYSGYFGISLLLLSILLSVVLPAGIVWSMAHWLRGKTALGTRKAPQPHDEPYTYSEPREPALEVLRERYARGEIDP